MRPVSQVTAVVPLCHTPAVAPMVEAALTMVDAYCSLQSLAIVGVYSANEVETITAPQPFAQKLAWRLAQTTPALFLLQLNISSLAKDLQAPVLGEFLAPAGERKCSSLGQLRAPSAAAIAEAADTYAAHQGHRLLADFDEHLDGDGPAATAGEGGLAVGAAGGTGRDWLGNGALLAAIRGGSGDRKAD